MTRLSLKSLLSVCLSAGVLASSLSLSASAEYYLLKSRGQSIGTVTVEQFDDADGRVTRVQNRNRFTRMGEPFEQVTTSRFVERSTDGQPLGFTHEFRIADQQASYAEGAIEHDQVRLAGQQAAIQPEQFYFPTGERLEAVYRAHYDDPAGSRFEYQTLHLALAPQVVQAQVTVLDAEKAEEPSTAALRKFEIRNPAGPDSAIYEWRDAQGRLVRALSADQGTELVYAGEQLAQARKDPLTGQARFDTVQASDAVSAVDVMTTTRVVTNVIDMPQATYDATYRIRQFTSTGQPLARLLPQDARQQIISTAEDSIDLRVKRQALADTGGARYPVPLGSLDAAYLSSNPYIQSADPAIRKLAQSVTGQEARAYVAAQRLRGWVYQNIRNKTLSQGLASATETLATREGDCTEHAVLLAALTRSLGIPSRVAVGLTYLPGEQDGAGYFVYHMWTEVYTGERGGWMPLDATTAEPMVDATHIKLADSPLRNADDVVQLSQALAPLLGALNIQVVNAVAEGSSHIDLSAGGQAQSTTLAPGGVQELDLKAAAVVAGTKTAVKNFQFDPPPMALDGASSQGGTTQAIESLAQGDYDAAVSRLAKVSAQLSGPVAHYQLAQRLTALDLYSLAQGEFNKAVAQDASLGASVEQWQAAYFPTKTLPESLERRFFQGVGLVAQGDTAGARAAFQSVLTDAPDYAPAHLQLARLAKAEGDRTGAIAGYEAALQRMPQHAQAGAELGDLYLEGKQYAQAVDRYRRAKVMLQLMRPSDPQVQALENRYRLAQAAWDVQRNKRNAQAWASMGRALIAEGRPADALDALHNALVVAPGLSEARAWQFDLLMDQARWEELATLYPRYSGVLSRTAKGLQVKSRYELQNRQYDQALQTAQQAAAAAPGSASGYTNLAGVYDYLQAARPAKADEYDRQAVRVLRSGLARVQGPERSALQYALARRLIEAGKTVEAAPVVQAMLSENPMNPLAHQMLGLQRYYQGDPLAALESLEHARALDSADPQTLRWMGDAYRDSGQIGQAYQAYQAALALRPGHAGITAALVELIEQHQLAAKKPERFTSLNLDERAYYVQMLRGWSQYVRSYEAMNAPLAASLSAMPTNIDISYIEFVEALEAAYQRQLKELEQVYLQARRVKPPVRLKGLQQAYLQTLYSYLVSKQAHLAYIGNNAFGRRTGSDDLGAISTSLNGSLGALASQFDAVRQTLSPDDWAKIQAEAGVADVNALMSRLISMESRVVESLKAFGPTMASSSPSSSPPGSSIPRSSLLGPFGPNMDLSKLTPSKP